MRHGKDGRQFARNTSHRKAMFKNMANSVISEEVITTTVQKAKETSRVVDRLITLGKRGDAHARRLAFNRTRDKEVVQKLFDELAKRYAKRPGGYTRVLKLAKVRRGDGADMAQLELIDHPELNRKKKVTAAPAEGKEAEAAAAAAAQAGTATAGDPHSGYRKMFGGSRKKGRDSAKAGAAEAKGRAEKAAKEAKAQAAEAKKAAAKKSDSKKKSETSEAKKTSAKKSATKKK